MGSVQKFQAEAYARPIASVSLEKGPSYHAFSVFSWFQIIVKT
jgi:hypothetical protein